MDEELKNQCVEIGQIVKGTFEDTLEDNIPQLEGDLRVEVMPALPDDAIPEELEKAEELLERSEDLFRYSLAATIPEGVVFETAAAIPADATEKQVEKSIRGCFTENEIHAITQVVRQLQS